MNRLAGYLESHPKVMLAVCGALVAVEAFKLFEACHWLREAAVRAHLQEIAGEAARAASEALGG